MAVVVERTFTVAAAPPVVMHYLEDFSNAEEWDPGTVRCTRRDTGRPQETAARSTTVPSSTCTGRSATATCRNRRRATPRTRAPYDPRTMNVSTGWATTDRPATKETSAR